MAAGHPVRQAKSGAPAEAGPPLSISEQARPTLERERALEFQRRVGRSVRQSKLDADIHGEFRTGGLWGIAFGVVIIALADVAGLLAAAAGLPEQGRADAMDLIFERAGIGQILDLAKHLDPDAPMLGEVVLAPPAIFEAEAFLVGEGADLLAKKWVEGQQELAGGELDDGPEPELVSLPVVEVLMAVDGLLIAKLEGNRDAVAFAFDDCEFGLDLD